MNSTTRKKRKTTRKQRILVVEDDAAVMKMHRALLTRNGYAVSTASYGLPAMFRVVRNPPDLILVDLNMPLLNGLELIDQFKAHRETRDIPIVVVTGSHSEADRKAAFDAGCVGYLAKPVDPQEFLARVAEFLKAAKI